MRGAHIPAFQSWTEYLMAWLERRTPDMLGRMSVFDGLKVRDDPEAIFQEGRFLCDVGEHRGEWSICDAPWRRATGC